MKTFHDPHAPVPAWKTALAFAFAFLALGFGLQLARGERAAEAPLAPLALEGCNKQTESAATQGILSLVDTLCLSELQSHPDSEALQLCHVTDQALAPVAQQFLAGVRLDTQRRVAGALLDAGVTKYADGGAITVPPPRDDAGAL